MARILILDDTATTRASITDQLQRRGHSVCAADSLLDGRELLDNQPFEIVFAACELPDGTLLEWLEEGSPGEAGAIVVALCETADWEKAGACLDKGAFDYLTRPISAGQLNLALARAEHALKWQRFGRFAAGHGQTERLPLLTGRSEAVEELRQTVRQSSQSRATILIQGEYGSGQAEAALALAAGVDQNVIRFDCASVSDSEMEASLFGGREGALTGALELANGGTIILENASLLSWGTQAALLHFLKMGETAAAGEPRKLDVRIIATVHENLLEKVRNGEFREELFHALNILPVALPPLRERQADIPALAEIFRQRQVRRTGAGVLAIAPRSLAALQEYSWPGNLAELRMVIERAVVLCGEGVIEPEHLRLSSAPEASCGSLETLAELERRHILHVLQRCEGNRIRTAETLGISIRTLRNKLKEYREVAEEEAETAFA